MKKMMAVVALIWFCGSPASPAADNYPVTIHVSASQLANITSIPNRLVVLDTAIDGKKYELSSDSVPDGPIVPGDYKARLASSKTTKAYEVVQTYELMFPDGATAKYTVTGVSE